MKPKISTLGRYTLLFAPLLITAACGGELELKKEAAVAGKMGQTETIQEVEDMPKMLAETVKTETMPTAVAVESKTELGLESAAFDTDLQANIDASVQTSLASEVPAIDPELGLNELSHAFYAGLPYYCDPARYPLHIIKSINACKAFLHKLWGTSYGYYHYLPRAFGPAYKVRNFVGSRYKRFSDDDDDDGKRRFKRKHKNFDNDNDDGNNRRGPRGNRGRR